MFLKQKHSEKKRKRRKKKLYYTDYDINFIYALYSIKITLIILLLYFNIKRNFESNHIENIPIQITIEKKNINFENSDLTMIKIQNKLNEIILHNQNMKIINESFILNYIRNNSYENRDSKEISLFVDKYRQNDLTLENIKNFNICENPNISIIIPTYNSQDELFSLQKNIQDQSLKNIEIIYIDNNSTDNTTKLIKQFQEKDKRIILLENKGNKGPFYSRNKGVIFAKGEYIQFLDSDDLLFENTLEKAYLTAKLKNIDVVQYKTAIKYETYQILNEKTKDGIIFQPELSEQIFYGKGWLEQTNHYIFNKIIKTEIYLKALIFMGEDILKKYLFFNEDLLQLFNILRIANSLLFINDIGYIKLNRQKQNNTLFGNMHNPLYANKILYDNFIEVKYIYNKTNNTEHDKETCYEFLKMTKGQYGKILKNITQGYELFDEVFNLLLNSEFIQNKHKKEIQELKDIIMVNHNKTIT